MQITYGRGGVPELKYSMDGLDILNMRKWDGLIQTLEEVWRKKLEELGITQILGMIDLPLKLKLMMFRLVTQDGYPFPLPNLILPVNPDSVSIKFRKKSELVYTSGGFVTTHWHEDKTVIHATGYTPSFGNHAKVVTGSYALFSQLLKIYTLTGHLDVVYNQNLTVPSSDVFELKRSQLKGNFGSTGHLPTESKNITVSATSLLYAKVQLIYQHEIYEGIFNNFSIEEKAEQPNTIQYSFEFHADRKLDSIFGFLGYVGYANALVRFPVESLVTGFGLAQAGLLGR